jgi:O-antigen/teichoic acid export membrane protein
MDQEADKTKSIFRQAVINTISNYGGKIVTLGVWFFLTPFILNRLGQGVYGMWVMVGSLVSYGSLLDFGIANAITKYMAEYQARGESEEARSLVATALWLYTIVGLAAIILGAVFAPIFPHIFNVPIEQHNTFSWLVFLSGIGLGISLPSAAPIAVLRGMHRFDVINIIGITGMLLLAGSTVLVLHLGGGAIGLVAVNILVNLLMQIPAIWLIHRNARQLHFGFRGAKRSHLRTVASFSSALFVISIAGQLRAKTDEIVVGSFLSVSSVTPYSIAHRLSDLPQIMTDQFMKVLMPLSSKLHSEKDHGRFQLYIISTRLTGKFPTFGIGCPIWQNLTAWVGSAIPYAIGTVVSQRKSV